MCTVTSLVLLRAVKKTILCVFMLTGPQYGSNKLCMTRSDISIIHFFFTPNSVTEAACTWTDRADTVGLQAAATQVNGVFSLDDCKAKCEENANCVAVEWQEPFLCYTYTTLTATATLTGRTYSTKTCTTGTLEIAFLLVGWFVGC